MFSIDADLTAQDCVDIGCALMIGKKGDKAIPFFDKALSLDADPPTNVTHHALVNIGGAHINCHAYEIAVPYLRRAVQIKSDNHGAWLNLGIALQACTQIEEARECIIKAMEYNPPEIFDCYSALSMNAQYRGDLAEAICDYQICRLIDPNSGVAQDSLGMMQMLSGNFKDGLRNYEARIDRVKPYPTEAIPKYEHDPKNTLSGKRVLICAEQGIGDAIQFSRYFRLLKLIHPTSELTYISLPSMADWVAQYGHVQVVTPGPENQVVVNCEVQIPLMSLMLYFQDHGVEWRIPEERPPFFREWTPSGAVGFCWRGNKCHAHDRFRSMHSDMMLSRIVHPIKDAGFKTVNLQFDCEEELKPAFDESPPISSWFHTASVIKNLDAVVTVDTAVAHMAATLGVPTFMMVPVICDWRWGMTGETTLWYKTMRIFRQTKLGDWNPVIEQVVNAVEGLKDVD